MSEKPPLASARRWRLALGRFADRSLGGCCTAADTRMDRALDHVYGRAYTQRGLRLDLSDKGVRKSKRGGDEASVLALPEWLDEMRSLFPRSVNRIVQGHALARFGMTEILDDARAMAELQPDPDLLTALLGFKGRANPALTAKIRY